MTFWNLIYALALSSSCVYLMRFAELHKKVLAFVAIIIVANLPLLYGLSLVEWMDSVLGRPSLFLFFLSLSVCFVDFFAPREVILPLRSKMFIFIFGFVVFLGNLNLLWGFDLFSLDYKTQLIVILGVLFFAFAIDVFLGILYLMCLVIFAFGVGNNPISSLIDVSVWLYALGWILIENFARKKH